MQSGLTGACGKAMPGAGGSSGTILSSRFSSITGAGMGLNGEHFVVLNPGNVPMRFGSACSPSAAPKTGETKIIHAPKQTGEKSW